MSPESPRTNGKIYVSFSTSLEFWLYPVRVTTSPVRKVGDNNALLLPHPKQDRIPPVYDLDLMKVEQFHTPTNVGIVYSGFSPVVSRTSIRTAIVVIVESLRIKCFELPIVAWNALRWVTTASNVIPTYLISHNSCPCTVLTSLSITCPLFTTGFYKFRTS
jgi:hypothetical protein